MQRLSKYDVINQQLAGNNKYIIVKKIGSQSKTADIYLCRINDLMFVSKRYKNKVSCEDIKISLILSSVVLCNKSPHFNIVYRYSHESLLCELAQADLKMFLETYIRYDVMVNCLAQILLCILSFHVHTGMSHNDCYHGNFLFHRIPKGGSICYIINGKNVVIENLGYQWVINDFDMASYEENMYDDYKVVLEAFVNYKRIKKFNKLVVAVLCIINRNNDEYELFDELIASNLLFSSDGDIPRIECYVL